ncbi:MAG: hypothetical protein QM804_17270 [Propionicimonas sp.]
MQLPPIDVTRWTLRALKLLDDARRALIPEPRKAAKPEEPDRRRPDIW